MTQREEEIFVKEAFQALVDRKVVEENYFKASTVTDKDIMAFEEKFNIQLPSLLKTFLKTYAYNFNYICAALPADIDAETIQLQDEEVCLSWLELFSISEEEPMKDLYERMEGFRAVTVNEMGMEFNKIAHLLPVGDWYAGGGPLCIDLTKVEKVEMDHEDTWSLRFFDHEYSDWEEEGYLDEEGMARGDFVAPDFKTLLEWYFYGKYDKSYELQEESPVNYSDFIK